MCLAFIILGQVTAIVLSVGDMVNRWRRGVDCSDMGLYSSVEDPSGYSQFKSTVMNPLSQTDWCAPFKTGS